MKKIIILIGFIILFTGCDTKLKCTSKTDDKKLMKRNVTLTFVYKGEAIESIHLDDDITLHEPTNRQINLLTNLYSNAGQDLKVKTKFWKNGITITGEIPLSFINEYVIMNGQETLSEVRELLEENNYKCK